MSTSILKYRNRSISIRCLVVLLVVGFASCSKKVVYTAPPSILQEQVARLSDEKQIAYQFVTTSKADDRTFDSFLSESFISHDQNWEGEKATFIEKRNSDTRFTQMKPVRMLRDDSLVAVHSRMLGDTLRFRWDILRIEQQKIQEHWSNVNDSIGLNPDGHTEIDGPTIPNQLEKTDTNRAHVKLFIDQCMIREEGGAAKFFDFGLYVQHNRDVGDGLTGLLWGMIKMKRQGKVIKFKHNYHVIAEGNLVLSATEGYMGGKQFTFFDLFRIEENKIVEHWDIIAPIDQFLYYPTDE